MKREKSYVVSHSALRDQERLHIRAVHWPFHSG